MYDDFKIHCDKSRLLNLITQSTDKTQLEAIDRLVTQYSGELASYKRQDSSEDAIKHCTNFLQEISTTLNTILGNHNLLT